MIQTLLQAQPPHLEIIWGSNQEPELHEHSTMSEYRTYDSTDLLAFSTLWSVLPCEILPWSSVGRHMSHPTDRNKKRLANKANKLFSLLNLFQVRRREGKKRGTNLSFFFLD